MTRQSLNLRGIGAMIVAAGTFVANDTCMKLALEDAPPLQVLGMRGLSAVLWCLPLLLILGYGKTMHQALDRWVVSRALCEFVAIIMFIYALRQMPIADITAIMQITPLLVVAGGAVFWSDRVGPLRFGLIGLGIVGALLVAQPGSAMASPFAMLGFACAAGAAARDILSRKVKPDIPGLVVAFTTIVVVMTGGTVLSLISETHVWPTQRVILLLAAAGLLLMLGQLFIFLAFRFAPPRVVAPFNYSFTIWAMLSGLAVFHDVPNGLALAGIALIISTGLAVIFLDGRTRSGEPASPKTDMHVISN